MTPPPTPKVPDVPLKIAEPPSLEWRDSPVQVTPPSPAVLSKEGANGAYMDQSPVCSSSEEDKDRCSG